MALDSPTALYMHELSDMLSAEQMIEQTLNKQQGEVHHQDIKQALRMHAEQTRQHIQNLQQVFQILGVQPQKMTCYGIQGLKQELDSIKDQKPSPDVLDLAVLGADEKVEHYEIASYTMLLEVARLMGEQQVVNLLEQNMRQEEEMARRIQSISTQLGMQVIGAGAAAVRAGQQPGTAGSQP